MRIDILTLFPEVFPAYLQSSIIGRACAADLLDVRLHNIRDYTLDKHRRVDDYPFGGGAGMVMTPQPLFDCMQAITAGREGVRRIYLSPGGRPLTHAGAQRLSRYTDLVLVCGHYEGVDQRFIDQCIDEELSIGDYVLTGGELPALVVVDCVARQLPGVLGSDQALAEESFTQGLLEYPHYTRPAQFRGLSVPDVLLGGNHAQIRAWRQAAALAKTKSVRPELVSGIIWETERPNTDDLEDTHDR